MSNTPFDVRDNYNIPPNWSIVNCTTPAQYFHALRRQVGTTSTPTLQLFLDPPTVPKTTHCHLTKESTEIAGKTISYVILLFYSCASSVRSLSVP